MTVTTDRRGARHDRAGKYATKPQSEAAPDDILPTAEVAADPADGLTAERVSELYQVMNNAGAHDSQLTPAEFRDWLAKDLPGLTAAQRDRFLRTLVEHVEAREACRAVLNDPSLDMGSAVVYRGIPKWVRDRVSRRFVAAYVNAYVDEDGRVSGTARKDWADNVAWVDRMVVVLAADIAAKTRAARAASDAVKPVKRPYLYGINDPWVEHQYDPPPPF